MFDQYARIAQEAATDGFHKNMIRRGMFKSCLNCEERDKVNDSCGKYGVKPPMEVVVHGCPDWFIEIPF